MWRDTELRRKETKREKGYGDEGWGVCGRVERHSKSESDNISAEKWKGLLEWLVGTPLDDSITCLLSAGLCHSQSRHSVDLELRSFVDTTLNTWHSTN